MGKKYSEHTTKDTLLPVITPDTRARAKMRTSDFRVLANEMLWVLLTLLGVLTYFSEIRQYIITSFGVYLVGVLDGVVATISVLIVAFYLKSTR